MRFHAVLAAHTMVCMTTGEDCHDLIEAAAKFEWCNGSVGMAGNSWLGIAQYWAAMQQPPSLKAIAPWEGFSDVYREQSRRGGIPWSPFLRWVLMGIPGTFRFNSLLHVPRELTDLWHAKPLYRPRSPRKRRSN